MPVAALATVVPGPARQGQDIHTTTVPLRSAYNGTTVKLRRGNGQSTTVRVPQGVKDGQRLKVSGKGHSGPGGNGDLFVTIKVQDHPFFARDGQNVTVTVPVTVGEAALGATIEVPTLDGNHVNVRIPAGTSSGRRFRVKEKGFTFRREDRQHDCHGPNRSAGYVGRKAQKRNNTFMEDHKGLRTRCGGEKAAR